MKCPHCHVTIHDHSQTGEQVEAGRSYWNLLYFSCPACGKAIIRLRGVGGGLNGNIYSAFPNKVAPRPVPNEVPDPYKKDFLEACDVLELSPKASAALSRRNLQALLRDKAGTIKKDLADQITEVIAKSHLPTHIQEGLDAVRNIGNFAAHPIKSESTGEIVEVEPGEAELNLDVLESLFDFYFVQPALTAKRRAALNTKLKDANKPPLK
jgi:hypothetical protein